MSGRYSTVWSVRVTVWRGGGHKGVESGRGVRDGQLVALEEGTWALRSGVVSPVLGRSLSAARRSWKWKCGRVPKDGASQCQRPGASGKQVSLDVCWACKFGPPGL